MTIFKAEDAEGNYFNLQGFFADFESVLNRRFENSNK